MVGTSQSGTPYESGNGLGRPLFVLQDRYEVVNHLGQGGMGTVYVARDRRLGRRQCVVKKLRDDFFREEDKEKAMAFFEREADVLSKLQHSNIVHIHDSFKEDGDCYLVMEYVEGENLHQMLGRRGEPFPEEQVLQWASQIAEVLDYLHTNDPQIIYRDLKPSNIMIDTKDRVKLVDFGIARPYVEDSDNTHVVSAGYSPPEQYWGAADPRSDVYALGATMYFLLTGEEPLALQTSSPRKMSIDISEHSDMIVQRATAQDLLLRYQSALEMKEDIDRRSELKGEKSKATFSAIVALVALGVVLVVGTVVAFVWNHVESENNEKQARYQQKIQQSEKQLRAKEAELERLEQSRRGGSDLIQQDGVRKMTAVPNYQPPPAHASKPKSSTVAFREVDEAQLTDPDGLAPPEDDILQPQQQPQVPAGLPFMPHPNNE
jgi:serine/threonine protein kinase